MGAIGELGNRAARWLEGRSRGEIALACLVSILIVGYVDYVTGIWFSLSVIYAMPIAVAAWYVNRPYAYLLSAMSAAEWVLSDLAHGLPSGSNWIELWNGTLRLLFYAFLVLLLGRLHDLHRNLSRRVEERTAALTREIAERERLERKLSEAADDERRSIGQDIHDSLCQHLTGTALASQVLAGRLEARGLAEAADSQKIVDLVEEAIAMARGMAKGLQPVEPHPDGLMLALEEFAATTSELFRIACTLECDSPVLVEWPGVATHLYRIAQEAVGNAVRHGRATAVIIALETAKNGIRLSVGDNGTGMRDPMPDARGLGLKIMAERAKVIGARLSFGRSEAGGTELVCEVNRGDIPAYFDHE